MDALAGLLDGPRARGAFLLRALMTPPWSVRIQDEAPLGLVAMARGDAWLVPEDGAPVHLPAGGLAVMRGPHPYVFADDPVTAPQIVVHPGQHCTTPDGRDLSAELALGLRSWGNDPQGTVTMLIGCYQLDTEIGRRLLTSLPDILTLAPDDGHAPLVPLLAAELARDTPGQDVVLDRLVDLLLVTAVREWFARPDTQAPNWYRAHHDPIVGRALQLLHARPEQPWTVARLAARTGVGRATLARRFTGQVGEPPMSYLTDWRLTLAADLLREPGATVQAVARRVGYGSAFALSTAFKRVRGVSPRDHRAHHGPKAGEPVSAAAPPPDRP